MTLNSTRAPVLAPLALTLIAALFALALTACADKKDKAASQTAAKVNREEITVQQINFLLQQQRSLRPEQVEAASKQILDRLIDQQLTLEKVEAQKLDRDPRVVQQLEAARREILSRAYLEKIGEAAAKPTPEAIKAYYDDKPALFRERRVYSIQEIAIEAKPEQVAELRAQLTASKDINGFIDYLKAHDIRYAANQAVRTAEQLPLTSLDAFARMKDGQAMMLPSQTGVQVILLAGSRSLPIGEEQAKPAIEQYLLNDRRRKLVEDELKALRAAAKIEYFGKFAQAAASSVPGKAPAPAPVAASAAQAEAATLSKGPGVSK